MSASACIPSPAGGFDFGHMPSEFIATIGIASTAIRLETGYPGPKGYGFLHVRDYRPRIAQMSNLGFAGFEHFAESVARRYDAIRSGKKQARFQLSYDTPGYTYFIIVEFVPARDYWTIVTGLPTRRDKTPIVWKRDAGESEPSPTTPEPRGRFTTLSLPVREPEDGRS